jgi:hypothetical protein
MSEMAMITTHTTYQPFTLAEVASMTRVSSALQAKWRQRAFLRSTPAGHGRVDIHGIAELAVIRALDTVGIGPAIAARFAAVAAHHVQLLALALPGGHDDRDGAVQRLAERLAKRMGEGGELAPALVFGRTSMADGLPANYLVVRGQGEAVVATNDVMEALAGWPEGGGPVNILLNLITIAADLVERAPRPFATVTAQVVEEGTAA